MQFLGKSCQNNSLAPSPLGLAPPVSEILDPALNYTFQCICTVIYIFLSDWTKKYSVPRFIFNFNEAPLTFTFNSKTYVFLCT